MTQRQIIDVMLAKIEGLERELRMSEMQRGILRRQLYRAGKDAARERKKLKREIELLRQSP